VNGEAVRRRPGCDAGLTDPTVVTCRNARREILNETTRAEITTAMLDWLRTHHLTTT
jgi:alpha-beta hydrolase superfamily lysophospholipase